MNEAGIKKSSLFSFNTSKSSMINLAIFALLITALNASNNERFGLVISFLLFFNISLFDKNEV